MDKILGLGSLIQGPYSEVVREAEIWRATFNNFSVPRSGFP